MTKGPTMFGKISRVIMRKSEAPTHRAASTYCSLTVAIVAARTTRANRGTRTMPMAMRSEEHTSELQSLMRISYAVFCLKKKKQTEQYQHVTTTKQKSS